MEIHWYPGHMAKAKRLIKEKLKLIDVVIELLDARIPASSRNPDLNKIIAGKSRIVVLNKADLADPEATRAWIDYFQRQGLPAVPVNAATGEGINRVVAAAKKIAAPVMERLHKKGRLPRPVRAMILGIPNVGKSSLINRLSGQKKAKVEDRPGVTRGQQWIRIGSDFELLDTPGVLWPKLGDKKVALKLAFTGAIKDDLLNIEEIAGELIRWLQLNAPGALTRRYGIDETGEEREEILGAIGRKRGFLVSGGEVDTFKTAGLVLNEFRAGLLGKFTLDLPPKEKE